MILPDRSWNSKRGKAPYYDYLPHFLFDQLSNSKILMVIDWIKKENLTMFFDDEMNISRDNLRDLAGTGDVRSHAPKHIDLLTLFDNYIEVLEYRENILKLSFRKVDKSDLDVDLKTIKK